MQRLLVTTEQAALGSLAEEAFSEPSAGSEPLTADHSAGDPAQQDTAEAQKISERRSPGDTGYTAVERGGRGGLEENPAVWGERGDKPLDGRRGRRGLAGGNRGKGHQRAPRRPRSDPLFRAKREGEHDRVTR